MPVFSIELPDGRVMDAEAPNEAAALAGARQWFAANPRWTTQPPPQPAGRSGLTWGQWARDLVTGEYTTEHPNAEEFATAAARGGITPEEAARLPRGRDPQTFLEHVRRALGSAEFDAPPPGPDERPTGGLAAINRAAVTPDPHAQLDILRRNIPDLESRPDRHGNLQLRARSLGVNEWTYLNRPGISRRDLDELATGTLVTLPFFGMFGQGANLGQRLASGAVAGAGSSLTQDAAAMASGSEQGIDPLRAVIGGGVGAALAPGVPSAVGRAVARPFQRAAPAASDAERQAAANALRAREASGVKLTTAEQKALAASDALDVNIDLPRAATSPGGHLLGQATAQVPFLGRPITKAVETATGQIDEAVERVVTGLGSGSRVSAGEGARQGIRDWIGPGSGEYLNRLYDSVDNLIADQALRRPLTSTRAAAMDLAQDVERGVAPSNRPAIALVKRAAGSREGLTYAETKQLRTEIGARISGSILPEAGTSKTALQRLYGALTEDLQSVILRAGGKDAEDAFLRANHVARTVSEWRKDLAAVVGTEGNAPAELVMDRLVRMAGAKPGADINRLIQARAVIQKQGGEEAWNEVSSAVLRQMGKTKDGLSVARLRTEYEGLSKTGRDLLFGESGEWRKSLDKVMNVAAAFEAFQRAGNPSGTTRTIVGVGLGFGGISAAIAHPFMVLGGAAGHYALARWLSQPIPAGKVARWMEAYAAAAAKPNAAQLTLLGQASRALARVAADAGVTSNNMQAQLDDAARALQQKRDAIGPWRTEVHREPDVSRFAGNQTAEALRRHGVHPTNIEAAIGNAQLAAAMLRSPADYREPGTPAMQLIERRRAMGSAVGGVA